MAVGLQSTKVLFQTVLRYVVVSNWMLAEKVGFELGLHQHHFCSASV